MFSLIRATCGGSAVNMPVHDDALELYALGRMTREERLADIEEHLLIGPGCRDRLEGQEEFVQVLWAAIRKRLRRCTTPLRQFAEPSPT